MSDSGAGDNEMGHLSELSDRDIDRLLAGRLPPDGNGRDGLSAFVAELRGAYTYRPPEGVEDAHVAAVVTEVQRLAEVTNPAPAEASLRATPARAPKPMTRMRLAMLGACLALAAPLATVGLAAAGVALPAAIRAPFEALGIELPNQAESSEVNPVVHLPLGYPRATHHRTCASADNAGPGRNGCATEATGGKHGQQGASEGGRNHANAQGHGADGSAAGGHHGGGSASRGGGGSGGGGTGATRGAYGHGSAPTRTNGNGGGGSGSGESPTPTYGGSGGNPQGGNPEGGNPHGAPPGQSGSTPVGRPTSPPGNSGSNPHGGPPGITETAPVGHGGGNPGH